MKICHPFLFFSIRYAGGTSDLMYKICKAQANIGYEPTICSGSYRFDFELASSLSSVDFKIFRSFLDKLGFSLMPGLIRFARYDLKKFDVVHMHVFRTFQNLVLYYYCKKYDVPYVIDAHGAVPYGDRKSILKKLFDLIVGKKMLREARCLIAETLVGKKEYLSVDPKLDASKIKILSPPFDIDEFASLPIRGSFRKKYGLGDEKIVMFLGRVNYIKGIDFLIKGFEKFANKYFDAKLVIVGPDDGHMVELKLLAKTLGIEQKVIFTGFLFANQKVSALVDADIVVQTSRQEQGAWAPFEAVLAETPILVTSHTGAGEDVKRVNAGYLVDFDDVSGLADQLNFIFRNYEEAKQKTLTAKRYIEDNLSMSARIHEYTELYRGD